MIALVNSMELSAVNEYAEYHLSAMIFHKEQCQYSSFSVLVEDERVWSARPQKIVDTRLVPLQCLRGLTVKWNSFEDFP